MAFNRAIADEIKSRIADLNLRNVTVATFHSRGFYEIRKRYPNVSINKQKMYQYLNTMKKTWTDIEEVELDAYCGRVERLVNMFRFALPENQDQILELCEKHEIELFANEIDRAKEILKAMLDNRKEIDYMDMIYFPAFTTALKQSITTFKNVIVDECQDLNAAQHKFLERLIDPQGGRLIAVGDPFQCIYGFTGADVNSYGRLKNLLPNTVELPLSYSFRCPVSVIEHAQEIVPHILPSPTAQQGIVRSGSYTEIQAGDFILCRNTRPLVTLCMKYLSQSRKATIKGADIGANLVNMIKKTKAVTQDALFNKFDAELQKLIEKMKKAYPHKDPETMPQVVGLTDRIGALKAIALNCKTKQTQEIITVLNQIFTDKTEGIVLSTMHKSKGLEAKNIFIIEPQLCPAPYAKQPWQQEQEQNLIYVARTRAKEQLVYVNDWTCDENKRNNMLSKIKSLGFEIEQTN